MSAALKQVILRLAYYSVAHITTPFFCFVQTSAATFEFIKLLKYIFEMYTERKGPINRLWTLSMCIYNHPLSGQSIVVINYVFFFFFVRIKVVSISTTGSRKWSEVEVTAGQTDFTPRRKKIPTTTKYLFQNIPEISNLNKTASTVVH